MSVDGIDGHRRGKREGGEEAINKHQVQTGCGGTAG